MNRMLAGFRQGHTSVLATKGGRLEYRGLPFQFWTFAEGIFIAQAAPGSGYERYIGSRLVSIEAVGAEEALRQVNQTQSIDGQNEYLFFGTDILREANYLVGLHIARSAERVELTLEAPDGERSTIVVETFPERAPVRLLPTGTSQPPLYLRQPDQLHWHEALPEHDALYVQLNGLSDEPGETLEQYGLRLRAVLEEADPKNLIIDMRHNAGGSTNLYPELLRTLVAYSVRTDHKVYVLIGRRTYSAAGNLITELEQLADAVFLGEASSECCVLYGSPATFTLPYSGLRGSISTRRWSLSRRPGDRRRELHPDVPVQLTAADYFAGRDPVMEAAVRLIERGQSDAAHQ